MPRKDPQLPNLRATMVQQLAPDSQATLVEDQFPRHAISLQIFRNTSLATISSILRASLTWNFSDGQNSRNPVLGITEATVWGSATFTLEDPDSGGFFTPTSAGLRIAFVSRFTEHGPTECQGIRNSIRTLLHLSSRGVSTEDTMPGKHRLNIQCDYPEDLRLWLQEVKSAYTLLEVR